MALTNWEKREINNFLKGLKNAILSNPIKDFIGAIKKGNANAYGAGIEEGKKEAETPSEMPSEMPSETPSEDVNRAPTVDTVRPEGVYDIAGWQDFALQMRDEQWAREDAIRAETQAREDTAFSRAIGDLRRSGVNVNLLGNISPAESGGGITSATGIDSDTITQSMSADLETILQENQALIDKAILEIEQAFEKGENTKDRITEIVKSIITIGGLIGGKLFMK